MGASNIIHVHGEQRRDLRDDSHDVAQATRYSLEAMLGSLRFDAGLVSVLESRQRLEFFDGSRIMPGARGVFAINAQAEPFFFAASGAPEVPHAPDVMISPSGYAKPIGRCITSSIPSTITSSTLV